MYDKRPKREEVRSLSDMESLYLSVLRLAAYGPDDDLDIDVGKGVIFEIPPGYSADLTFSTDAYWEQALIIYSYPGLTNLVEKGTYSPLRNLSPTTLPMNTGSQAVRYAATGWYKRGGPSGGLGWNQSDGRPLVSHTLYKSIGFNDAHPDNDFNDIVVNVTLHQ